METTRRKFLITGLAALAFAAVSTGAEHLIPSAAATRSLTESEMVDGLARVFGKYLGEPNDAKTRNAMREDMVEYLEEVGQSNPNVAVTIDRASFQVNGKPYYMELTSNE